MKKNILIALLMGTLSAFALTPLHAQVAGASTTVGVSVTESTQLAMGWSVKKTIMGKTVYNELGEKVGKVEDLIVAPDRNVSYLIIGAGGFVGIGRHDVAIPVSQVKNQSGKLVMAGASKDMIKALPKFEYATDTSKRDEFVAKVETDLTKARDDIAALQKKASMATADAKAKLDTQITAAEGELKTAEAKLAELKKATLNRWTEFEVGVTAASNRLRKSLDKIVS